MPPSFAKIVRISRNRAFPLCQEMVLVRVPFKRSCARFFQVLYDKLINLPLLLVASLDYGLERPTAADSSSLCFEETKERISKLIRTPEISISSYDTAWVAMVPASHSSQEPCFPKCINWLLENQCHDGSWARPHHHHLLQKDVISSTLACIIALKRWGLGDDQINRGVHFIESNFASASGKDQKSPMGFDVIFGGMIEYARDLSLNLNLESDTLNDIIHKRNLELKRWYEYHSTQMEADMAYLSEGIGKLQHWDSVMKYQSKNGSLFNSPSTTSAACIFHHNDSCLDYLNSALKTFGNAVPAIYPSNVYALLHTVDDLERLGISQYFRKEIQDVLDNIYRCWLRGGDEIFMDASSCALAFRVLRVNGYDITSDQINEVLEREHISSFLDGHTRDVLKTLDLYRASEIIFPGERALEKHKMNLKHALEQELSSELCYSSELGRNIGKEVKHALQHPSYAIMERVANRQNIEQYNIDNTRILKTSICSPNFGNTDFLALSVADFNERQKMHLKELNEFERWVSESRLGELKFARNTSVYSYFSAAATFSSPELSEARLSWARNSYIGSVVDDFFDMGGSMEELRNLVWLFEEWDVDVSTVDSSQYVLILFSALKSSINETGDKAYVQQGRSVTKHLIEMWSDLLHSMLKESEWARNDYTPTLDEYIGNAHISFLLGPIVLPCLYLLGPNLSDEMVQHPDYNNLFKLMSTCARLLNDVQTYERELKQGKKNSVTLYMMNGVTEEVAVSEVNKMIDRNRRELRKLVLDQKKSVIPRACKDLFWHMSTVCHHFYNKYVGDGFTLRGLMELANNMLYEPIVLPRQL